MEESAAGFAPAESGLPSMPPLSYNICGKTDVQALRSELNTEREQLADHSNRVVQFQQICHSVDSEVRTRTQVAELKDSLRRQCLSSETKTASEQASEMRFSSDKGPALNEELKEVEEEGKVRREQLEAETSLMAMEVLTLTKGLGGRLVDSSLIGLSRSPFTVHDIRFRLNTMSRNTRNRVGSMDGKVSEALLRGARSGAA
eukprot:UN0917